jgi:hypothetical protein
VGDAAPPLLTKKEAEELDRISGSGFDIENARTFKELMDGMGKDTDDLTQVMGKSKDAVKRVRDELRSMQEESRDRVKDIAGDIATLNEDAVAAAVDRTLTVQWRDSFV